MLLQIIMKLNTIKRAGKSHFVDMGPIRLRQPFPTQHIEIIDPFVLLHHYGPYEISETNNPFDLGPHPHRGFEPVTFLVQGEQLHRDSLGNESVVKAGDVQWTTAGRGIIHAEGPTKDLVKKGGTIEGIQLWLNLPSGKKMIEANYQHAKHEEFNVITSKDKKNETRIIAGELDKNQLMEFNQDGEGFSIKAEENSTLLFLSGEPINEPVATYGPYVMNSQTELLEAMRDYQIGKMGFLPSN